MRAHPKLIDSTSPQINLSIAGRMRLQMRPLALKAMRMFIAAVILYVVAMTIVDAMMFGGRYRDAVWREASYQTHRVNAEVRHLLQKLGI